MEPVHKDIFYPIFNKIRGLQRIELGKLLNLKNVRNSFAFDYISHKRFEQLKEFYELINENGFSTIKEYVQHDTLQQRMYLNRLNNLINSSEFVTNHKKQYAILKEQKLIYTTVNQNN